MFQNCFKMIWKLFKFFKIVNNKKTSLYPREWTLGFFIYIRSNLKIFWSNVSTTQFFRKCPFSKSIFFGNYGLLWCFFHFKSIWSNSYQLLQTMKKSFLMNHFSLGNISSNSEKILLFIVSLFSFFQQSCNFFICEYFNKFIFSLINSISIVSEKLKKSKEKKWRTKSFPITSQIIKMIII